MICPL
jgi:hypothetical protein